MHQCQKLWLGYDVTTVRLSVGSTTGLSIRVAHSCEAALLPAFVWWEVASSTTFKKNKKF